MLENIAALLFCSILTVTAKDNKEVGYLVIGYYLVYIIIELGEFGYTQSDTAVTLKGVVVWYVVCAALSSLFSIWASVLYMSHGGAIWIYCAWLIFDAFICSILALSQVIEANALLLVYNVLQNINLYIDILIVIIGTDHIIKRKILGVSRFIDSVNSCSERWLNMVFNASFRGS